ncbi:MAG: hypothetical protein IPP51_13390 [Bacteroidetes bacterium]|nr:hypothetical protein [Bacteroidota bacterium]
MNSVFTQKVKILMSCVAILFGLNTQKAMSQTFDPCGPNGPGCSAGPPVMVFSPADTFYIAQAATIFAGAFDAQQKVDTTYNQTGSLTLISGPGTVSGTLTGNFVKGIAKRRYHGFCSGVVSVSLYIRIIDVV